MVVPNVAKNIVTQQKNLLKNAKKYTITIMTILRQNM